MCIGRLKTVNTVACQPNRYRWQHQHHHQYHSKTSSHTRYQHQCCRHRYHYHHHERRQPHYSNTSVLYACPTYTYLYICMYVGIFSLSFAAPNSKICTLCTSFLPQLLPQKKNFTSSSQRLLAAANAVAATFSCFVLVYIFAHLFFYMCFALLYTALYALALLNT